ncbi:MAG: YeeE/YedE family protein [Gammaproteobacteria bacterium]
MMQIVDFTPVRGLIGGSLIGLAAVFWWLTAGRIAGISGLLGQILETRGREGLWRWCFLAGLVMGAGGWMLTQGISWSVRFPVPWPLVAVSGVLVGVGAQMASGCTSGHGVCGLARGSRRSTLVVAVFLASGMLTVFVVRHGF